MRVSEKQYKAMPVELQALFRKCPNPGSDEVVGLFPVTTSGNLNAGHKQGAGSFGKIGGDTILRDYGGDSGSAARFFYCAKASRSERDRGCENLTRRQQDESRDPDAPGANNPRNRGGGGRGNHHPTVKPIALMQWLVRLVTPPGGLVLDPFAGSGTTGLAARAEGFRSVLIEREAEYVEILCARLGLDPFDDVEVVDEAATPSGAGDVSLSEAAVTP